MIREFRAEDAADLADMYNASDEGWPGGYTHGMDITPEMVLDFMQKLRAISVFVAWDETKIVGNAELTEYWKEAKTACVGFLNVIPSHRSKGYGRDLLKACVRKAAELKYNRLDVYTWPGNLEAVPLYKKTGFFWVPGTGVYMKNFLPLILNMDAAKPYFENHDWYTTLRREIKVEEDDFGGVYPYHWEENGDTLTVVIDAVSGGVTQFEDNEIFISQRVEDAFAGRPVKITWTMRNKTKTPFNVTLISKGDTNIMIERRESFQLEGELKLTGEAFIDPQIEVREEGKPPYLVTTEVIVHDKSFPLISGLRVKQPIEVSTYPEYLFLPAGSHKILAVLKNAQDIRTEGVLTCQNTGESKRFCIEPKYTEAVPFSIEAFDGELQFTINDTKTVCAIPIRVQRDANVMQKGKEVVLENTHFRVTVQLQGGVTAIYDKKTKKEWANNIRDQVGPPFWPPELSRYMYTVRTEQYTGKAVAEVTVRSKEHNIQLTRRMKIDQTPVIKIEHVLIPKSASLNFYGHTPMDGGTLVIPLKEGIVSESPLVEDFPLEHGDLPRDPSEYKEQWMCFERDGSVFGVIWERCTEVQTGQLGFLCLIMNPEDVSPSYLHMGSGTWKDVRAHWSHVHKKEVPDEEPRSIWEVNPSTILCEDDEITQEMTLQNYRGAPLRGVAAGIPFEAKRGSPFTFTKTFDGLSLGVNMKEVEVETALFKKRIPVSIVRTGTKRDISVTEDDIITFDNGLYTLRVAPYFHGAVIYFGKEMNHLLTSYPETTQFNKVNPWWGGIHPVVYREEQEFPGRMHKETFTHELIEIEKYNITWKGVKVISTLQEIRGIQLHTSYLTAGLSNVVVIESVVKNLTSAPFHVYAGILHYVQPEGSLNGTLYYFLKTLYERGRTPYGGWTKCHDWAAVKGGKTYLTVIADTIRVEDLGKDGAHLSAVGEMEIKPKGEMRHVTYFVAADSLEQSQQYRALRGITWT